VTQWTGAEAERFLLDHPDEAAEMLRGYHMLTGNVGDAEPEDLRPGSIANVRVLDSRSYSIGLPGISSAMRPIRAGETVVVGAREGNGKTSFGSQVALANSIAHKVLFCTLEATREEIREQMLAQLSHLSVDDVQRGRSEDAEDYLCAMRRLCDERDLLLWRPVSKPQRTIQNICKRAEDVGAEVLIIDYSRRIEGWRPGEAAGEVIDYVADWARSSSITVFFLAQLNRGAVGIRPHNGHLQDTDKLGQRADRVILLYRPFLGRGSKDVVAEVIISKNRCGPTFRGHAHWIGYTTSFFDMDEETEVLQECCRKRTRAPRSLPERKDLE
jgi:replicative DNA helicase